MTEKRDEKLLLVSVGLSALTALVSLTLATRNISALPAAAAPFSVVGLLLSLMVWLRMRLIRLSEDERREEELARREGQENSSLFGDGEFQPFTAARGRAQFERFIVPAFAPLLAIVQGAWAWYLYRSYTPAEGDAYLWIASILAGQAFLLFLLSRYLLGLSRMPQSSLLRGPGVILGVASLATVIAAAGTVLSHTLYPPAERFLYWGLAGYLAILSAESLLNFIGECYRPRSASGKLNRAYESRVSGLFTDPASWVNSVAQALDYQFGFNVSETWFYRFLQGALLPLLLFQIAVLYLLSSLVFIQPHELGIRERFGKPLAEAGPLESGMHMKWPWPFETVRRFPAKRIQSFHIGLAGAEDPAAKPHAEDEHGPAADPQNDIVIWSQEHHVGQDIFLVASSATEDQGQETVPVNFLNVDIPVEYRIKDVFAYAYGHADPRETLEQVAQRTFSREASHRDLFDIMATRKQEIADTLLRNIQSEADALGLGVEITFVGLQGVHPPSDVVEAFESVIGATEEKEAAIHNARAEAGRLVPLAKAQAEAEVDTAEAYKVRREAASGAETDRFVQLREAYSTAPSVFRTRRYLRVLRDSLEDTRKYIIGTSADSEVIQFNFEEQVGPDGFDFGSASRKGTTP